MREERERATVQGAMEGPAFEGPQPRGGVAPRFQAAGSARGKVQRIYSSKHFGRANGCRVQPAPLRASRGRESLRKANALAQRWPSTWRLPTQFTQTRSLTRQEGILQEAERQKDSSQTAEPSALQALAALS
eukprot:9494829-Pyramimonas_sp.AAC.1